MTATVKTEKGIHKMTMDRWGDSTHRMSAYNNHHKPSFRDQRQIDRMEGETMVLYPTLPPNLVLPMRSPRFCGGRGMFPRGNGGIKSLNWRAEGLRAPPPRNGSACLLPECGVSFNFSSLLQTAKGGCPLCNQKKVQQKKSFKKAPQESALLPSIPPVQVCLHFKR